jgi:hypothetical protein
MSMAAAAVRGPLQSPMGQWALVALGAMYVANPEKFFQILRSSVQLLLEPPQFNGSNRQSQQPIVIHTVSGGGSGKPFVSYILQLAMGAGVCWGSYMIMASILPEAAKGLLPVTRGFFSTAITSLGKGIINVRDSLMKEILGLGVKQDEMSEKLDETHSDVLNVKDNVGNIRMDLGRVQQVLDDCQLSLTEAEKRHEYIGQGVRLLTRGVSSLLPPDADLAYELNKYNRLGSQILDARPQTQVAVAQPQPVGVTPQEHRQSTPMVKADMVMEATPHQPPQKQDLDEIRALLHMVQYGGSVQVVS